MTKAEAYTLAVICKGGIVRGNEVIAAVRQQFSIGERSIHRYLENCLNADPALIERVGQGAYTATEAGRAAAGCQQSPQRPRFYAVHYDS